MVLERGARRELERIVGPGQVLADPAQLVTYSYDATPGAPRCPPEAVLLPGSSAEVAAIIRLAAARGTPIVARGAGTGMTGGARPIHGGWVVSTQRLDRILRIDLDNLQAVVQPGVVTEHLQEAVAAHGLFYPVDPQSLETCTLGGNLAENAGGPRAVKYGVTRQYALACEAALADGELARFGARTLKSVAGYDMLSLLVGSEGTLGVITEASLRLLPQPAARGTLLAAFGSLEAAAAAVGATLRAGVVPAAIEFVDHFALRAVGATAELALGEGVQAVLVVEVDGPAPEVARQAEAVRAVMRAAGADRVALAASPEEAARLWRVRRQVGPALAHIAPHKLNEDIVVPIARLPEAVAGVHRIAREARVACACFGHAGDGNIHVNFLVHPEDAEELARAGDAVRATFELAVALGGSISGEHGIGTAKQPFLGLELGPRALGAMRAVKAALDPQNILNPGKIFLEP